MAHSRAVGSMSLQAVCARTELSERWVRELVKRHGLAVRKVPCPGGGRYVFTRDDVERIWRIHEGNQAVMQRRYPAFFESVGKLRARSTRSDEYH